MQFAIRVGLLAAAILPWFPATVGPSCACLSAWNAGAAKCQPVPTQVQNQQTFSHAAISMVQLAGYPHLSFQTGQLGQASDNLQIPLGLACHPTVSI